MNLFDVYSVFDIEIARASGSYLWDKNGRRYLDLYGGHAVISIGHTHPHYVSALTAQLERVGFYSNSVRIAQQEELAFKLGALSGYDDYSLFLCNSGAEANENAFKIASFVTGRKKIIAFKGAFHGRTSLAVAATDNPKIVAPVNETDNVVFVPLNDIEALDSVMDDSVAAVIIEGIQGVAGIHYPTDEFLKAIEQRCHRYGAMMILDEVQSGYGRTGRFFAHQHAGVRPHLVTMAKGMGNGFPVAGVLIAPGIPPRKEMLGTTFGGNYLACAAAIAVLDVIKHEGLISNAATMGAYLAHRMVQTGGYTGIRGRGLMLGIEPAGGCDAIRKELLWDHGIFTGSASDKRTMRLLPSLAVSTVEIDEFINAYAASVKIDQE